MKKILSLLLASTLVFALVACSNEKDTTSEPNTSTHNTTQSDTESTDDTNTELNESNTTDESSSDTETPSNNTPTTSTGTSKPTTNSKPNNTPPTQKPTNNKQENSNNSSQNSSTQSTPSKPSNSTQSNSTEPYLIGLEVIKIDRPNACYIDGKDLLSILYMKDLVLQVGDIVTLKVIMSNGGNKGFEIEQVKGGTYKVDGNIITCTVLPNKFQLLVEVSGKDVNDKKISKSISFNDVCSVNFDGKAVDNSGAMFILLRDYGERLGMTWEPNGTTMTGYTANNESLSITGDTYKGRDDYIPIPNNPNWVKDVINLLKKYKEMGIKRFKFSLVYEDAFASIADYN